MGTHLAGKLPYEETNIPPEITKAHIDAMLHEFIMLDPETKERKAWVAGTRWTEIPPQLPLLEFMVDYEREGVRKKAAIRIQAPMLYRKVKRNTRYGR